MTNDHEVSDNDLYFLREGGEMGRLIRSRDWSFTSLGKPEHWPVALKHSVSIMLATAFPSMICWGKEHIQLYNDAFRMILGESKHTLALGGSARDTFAEVWDSVREMFRPAIHGHTLAFSDFMITLERNGYLEDCYFDLSFSPIRDEKGQTEGVLVIAIDVSERIKARKVAEQDAEEFQTLNEELAATNEEFQATNEELVTTNEELMITQRRLQNAFSELTESEARLAMAIQATNLGTLDYHSQKDELFLSEESRFIFGFPRYARIRSEDFFECLYSDDRKRIQKALQITPRRTNSKRYQITCRMQRFDDGSMRWIRIQGLVYFHAEEQFTRYVATILDITESKLAEERSAKLAAIVDSSNDAIISKTLESVITSWNSAAERMFGYKAEEIIGDTIYRLIPTDLHEEEPQILSRLKSGERVQHFETKRLTRDGRLIDVSLTISPVKDEEGKIIGLSKIARDITEKKQDETRKNDFIAMVSHELKTPLTSLTAIIQILYAKFKGAEDKFVATALHKANLQLKKMTDMINGFLDVSRLQSGKLMLYKQDFDMEALIEDTIEEFRLTVPGHPVQFTRNQPAMVYADQGKIASVITNLISNALKYSPEEKPVVITCSKVNDQVQVRVCDEGIGIKPIDREMLFERFYRVENEHTQTISGFGIGLYLSAEIIARHQGEIWVESTFGQGSAFYFSLPSEDPSKEA